MAWWRVALCALAALALAAGCKDKDKKKDEWATGKFVPPPEPKKEKLAPLTRFACAAAGSLTTWRYDPVLAPLPGGKVLVAGGRQGKQWLSSSEIFDPATGKSRRTGPMKARRALQDVLPLADGRVLVLGGGDRSLELFDPKRNAWSVAGQLKLPAVEVAAAQLPDGQVYIAGGESTDRRGMARDAYLWQPRSGALKPLPPLKRPLKGKAIVDEKGQVLLLARLQDETDYKLWRTDPGKGTLEPAEGKGLLGRAMRELARMPKGDRIKLVRGPGGRPAEPPTGLHGRIVLRFFPSRLSWRTLARPLRDHDGGAAVALADGRVLVLGGANKGASAPELCKKE